MSCSEAGLSRVSGRRRALIRIGGALFFAGAGPLAGCFRPMLSEDSSSSALIGRIALPHFDDRFGYHLHQSLQDRLGRVQTEEYRLEVTTQIKRDDLAIAQDNAITRISVTATADWALYPLGASEPVLRDRAVSQSGYNSTASLFATREAKLDIERRLARDLGERIARSILARAGAVANTGAS